MSSEPVADKAVFRGEVVEVPTKNPVTSYRWWGSVVAIFAWGLVVAVKRGWLPEEIRQPVQDLGLEVIAGVIGTLAALVGGWKAAQPLAWSDQHVTKTMKTLLPLMLLLPLFAGCAALTSSAPESWVRADRATHDAVAPEYLRYVDNDPAKTQEQKDSRHLTVETWDRRLTEHETSLAKPAN